MAGIGSADRPELPEVCALGPDDGPARMRRWQRLHETASPSASLAAGALEIRYQTGAGVREELEDLAAAEQQCCSFADWIVTMSGDHVVLRVVAPREDPDAIRPIAALFGATGPGAALPR